MGDVTVDMSIAAAQAHKLKLPQFWDQGLKIQIWSNVAPWFGLQTTFFTYQQEQKVNSLSKADKLNTNSCDFALIMTPECFCSLDLASPQSFFEFDRL